ncbi:MAG: lactonase family protein, partial [Actinobacteria bacterium]|nr:lactonase family protein [Actinomycetota bacterium]NIS31792.1 lactonase family protein [Actinomycetota bacterium]NIT94793.1 lactonase family protein [Actinomycetota bacterium]NIU18461.1 lactonase family protein [Actinomycetota bacterium]NIU66884.1 lactonase family protein [Actinomycetota bacterium]
GETGIGVFACDESQPALRPIGGHSGVTNPSYIVLDADASHLYAVSECAAADDGVGGSVHAFRIERSAGTVGL